MKPININNTPQLLNRTRKYAFILDSYLSRLDLIKNSISAQDATYVYNYELSSWTYDDITDAGYLMFYKTLPADIDTGEVSIMHYSLYNLKYLGIYDAGTVTSPELVNVTDTVLPFWWSKTTTDIYLYIPSFGSVEDKYSFWLPSSYTATELSIFFERAHTFYIDYKSTT
ncbi:MAG: hypothetical protein WC942_10250 [Clostridia bacterium]|jgi:hypothetical protein